MFFFRAGTIARRGERAHLPELGAEVDALARRWILATEAQLVAADLRPSCRR